MTVYRAVLAKWASEEFPSRRRSIDGQFTDKQIKQLNDDFYHIYFWPNYPSEYTPGTTVDGSQIDAFQYVFMDCDLKDKVYADKQAFLDRVGAGGAPTPTFVVDSGNGLHVYFEVSDLDAMSFLRLNRRLCRAYRTDPAVCTIGQLMRAPGTINPKHKGAFKECKTLLETEKGYTCEELDKLLPPLTLEDEEHCKRHFNTTYRIDSENYCIDDNIPLKFAHLLKNSSAAKDIWAGNVDDRSKGDWRLGHLMFANNFTKDEATSVLVNSAKALARAPVHRISYARNIVDKIWTFEEGVEDADDLSQSIQQILDGAKGAVQGQRIRSWSWIDNTKTGFCLGHVIGLVGGVKTGKTALSLNMIKGFLHNNPDMDHIFVALEQPAEEITAIWERMCTGDKRTYSKLRIISNYKKDGSHRNLSQKDIEDYVVRYQEKKKRKVGAVVIDHIGALKAKGHDRFKPIEDICHEMKPAAIRTNTVWIMQSHAPREKAGFGDMELNQDAAYGTQRFEAYVDWLITAWQPLKRTSREEGCPKVTGFKFAAIRHKESGDLIQENECYKMAFDPDTKLFREMTQAEDISFDFFLRKCVNKRKQDRNTDIVAYTSIRQEPNATTNQDSQDLVGAPRAS